MVPLQLVPEQHHRRGCLQVGQGSARTGRVPPQAEVSGVPICQVLSWWLGGGQRAPLVTGCEVPGSSCYRLFCWVGVAQFGGGGEWGVGGLKLNMNTPHWSWVMPPPWTRGLAAPGGRANSGQVVFLPSLCFLIWKMGTISMAYRKRLEQCLALVLNKYWSCFPRGWQG